MSPANRPGGRERRTVSGGGNAYRRGSGLGSGSVGGGSSFGGGGSSGSGGSGGNRGIGSGGGGYLRILRFDPKQDTIEVITYSPYLDKFGCEQNFGDGFGESKLLEHTGLQLYEQQ